MDRATPATRPSVPNSDPGDRLPLVTVVIPVYGNESSIPQLIQRLAALATGLGSPLECVFVIDASPDRSRDLIAQHVEQAPFTTIIVDHTRNFGAFAAIRTGLTFGSGSYFAVMAADLQEPPELIEAFVEVLSRGPAQVAVGARTGRPGDPRGHSLAASAYWRFYRRFVIPSMPAGGVDVFACTSAVRDQLLGFNEANSSLIGLLFWLGYPTATVPYERGTRAGGGKSSWTLRKKIAYLADSVYSFTDLPLRLLRAIGLVGLLISSVAGILVTVAWWRGAIDVRGYTPVILAILFSTMLLLSAIGILGSYVWRAYENSKRRPLVTVMSVQRLHGS